MLIFSLCGILISEGIIWNLVDMFIVILMIIVSFLKPQLCDSAPRFLFMEESIENAQAAAECQNGGQGFHCFHLSVKIFYN